MLCYIFYMIVRNLNHFQCFDYILDCAEDVLTEIIIKKIHAMLKSNTSDSRLEWFCVGEYKQRPDMIGDAKTAPPGKVKKEMQRLLFEYQQKDSISFLDIVEFHYYFEKIHPFQDAHVIIGTRLEKPSKINGFALLSPNFFMPERGERNHHTSTYIAGQQYESLIAIKATIPSFGDGFEGPKSL